MPARIIDEAPIDGSPTDDEPIVVPTPHIQSDSDVVITGISCRLPESDNMTEFREHLVKGEDMVTEDNRRWDPDFHGLPRRSGKLKDISCFDASFFGVHPKQANSMDPQLRLLLEVTHEAIVDAGVDPASIRGQRTGVFIGCSVSEAHEAWSSDMENIVGYEMTGCTKSMFANRLSYFFDFKGPSYAIDTACSSSLLALDHALQAIRAGLCDSAIVGGSNLCLKPSSTSQFMKLGMLSPDGSCKSFDESGNGYCRSEGIVAIYLQKASEAKRVYATVVHSKTNTDGNKKEGITFPSGDVQKQLVTEVYKEAKVDPAQVVYVEAHGTGTKAGDPQEVNAIVDVFCKKGRKGPLLIGSTKSNMGHPEPASGLSAVAKCLIAMEDGYIPANLHYKNPNPDIPGLVDGSLQVVSERTKWPGGYVGINSFGFGGSNVHVLLHSNQRNTSTFHPSSKESRLFTICGRTEEGVSHVLKEMKAQGDNIELQSLLEEYSNSLPSTNPYRGYTVLNNDNDVSDIQKCAVESRPVWYIFAGMGTQWHGMGRDLMGVDKFKQSIMKSDVVLKKFGVNLYEMLMSGDESTFDNTMNSFIGIAAIQVALVDVLKAFGIEPDGIVGHSVGELGCAYADGGLTSEETVLAAYWRGRCVTEAKLPPGGMAAVGMTWEEALERCPDGVVPACHNSEDTVTISGPAEAVTKFVAQLKEEDVFAKEVKSAGVAFHSYFMANTAPALKAALQKVIKEARIRTSRWISSSIPEHRWHEELAKYSSAEYHVNNLVSPVLFQEALQHVPKDAVAIEIAPHCLLQAILKRSLGTGCTFVGLMKRNHPNNLEFLFSSLGKCYNAGATLKPLGIHQKVNYPVARNTPMVSPLLKWDHSQSWDVPNMQSFSLGGGGRTECVFEVDVAPESKDHYLTGHKIDGRVLFPATGYLVLAWRALAKQTGQIYDKMPVLFEDVHIHRATILPKSGSVKFEVSIMQGTGDFEVCESGALVVNGRISNPANTSLEIPVCEPIQDDEDSTLIQLTSGDIYKELRLRGYDYGQTFQGILCSDNRGREGQLLWNSNWVSFTDTMLQMSVLGLPGRSLRLPTRIKSIKINPILHADNVSQFDSERQVVKVIVDRMLDACVSGGVEILGLHATVAPRKQLQAPPVLEKFSFVPYLQDSINVGNQELEDYLTACKSCISSSLERLTKSDIAQKLPCVQNLNKHYIRCFKDLETQSIELCTKSCLLKLLREISSLNLDDNFLNNVQNIIHSYQESLKTDKLLTNFLSSSVLKPCVDVVLENSHSKTKMTVVEIGASKSEAYRHVIPFLNTQPMLNVDYTVMEKNFDLMDESTLESFHVKSVKWDHINDALPNVPLSNLVIASNILCQVSDKVKVLSYFKDLINDDGFILIHEYTQNFDIPLMLSGLAKDLPNSGCCDERDWMDMFRSCDMEVVAKTSDGLLSTVFLCRKTSNIIANPVLLDVSDVDYDWIGELKNHMEDCSSNPLSDRIWLVSDSDPCSGIIGLVNCLRQESGGDKIRCIFNASLNDMHSQLDLTSNCIDSLQRKNLVMNIFRDQKWGSFRHIPITDTQTRNAEHAYVNVLTRGDLSSLKWIESPLKYFNSAEHVDKQLCSVYYTSLNFRDVMLATGKLPPDAIPGDMASQDCILGMEFSGRDKNGERIMGLLPAKGLATTVDVDKHFIWPVPPDWSLREAASVPVVYTTVFYALLVRGRIRKGDKILIHSGSGGVGQAAISVALHEGCEVYTTVGSVEKKEFLKKRFTQLKDKHFANSRDRTFEWDILRATNGRGVDLILNSLAEEKLHASLRILAPHGRFLEIGKYDLSNNSPLGMAVFLRNITFHGILLDALFEEGNQDWHIVSNLLTQGIKNGAVRPLQTTVFDKEDVEGAFRFMAQGKHIGKVLVKVREEEANCVCPRPISIQAQSRSTCHPKKSYIITGGLGGFGLELSQWLVERGALNLILTSRSGIKTGYQSRKIRLLREQGVNVKVSMCNVKTVEDAELLVKEAAEYGRVGGVFHLAMVLRDGLFENQSAEAFQQVAEPKIKGTHHLDKVTREYCSESLDWFVVFSSVSCGRGNAGQSNYGFANSTMERICEKRKQDGYPALAIQWGAIGDVGVVLENMGDNETVIGGTTPQRISSCLTTLDQFLNEQHPVVSSMVLAEKERNLSNNGSKADLVQSIAHILGVTDVDSINADTSLGDLGLDSLMGVEVKQTLERDYDLTLPMKEIRLLTVNKLKGISAGGSIPTTPKADQSQTDGNKSLNDSGVSMNGDTTQIMMPLKKIVHIKDGTGKPMFLIHPIEGMTTPLEQMALKLPFPVYGVQCTKTAPLTSIPDLAAYYVTLLKDIDPHGPYRLAGYSFGACVAFEMALQLEGAIERLVLLDGSHAYVAAHTQHYKAKLLPGNQAAAESEVLCAFLMRFMNIDYAKLSKELQCHTSWNERVKTAVSVLMSKNELIDESEVSNAMNSFYHKLVMADSYSPEGKLSGDVLLIKAKAGTQQVLSLGNDLGLGQVCNGDITQQIVEGDHTSFIQGASATEVAKLIESYLIK